MLRLIVALTLLIVGLQAFPAAALAVLLSLPEMDGLQAFPPGGSRKADAVREAAVPSLNSQTKRSVRTLRAPW
jgi:hypothetical protein